MKEQLPNKNQEFQIKEKQVLDIQFRGAEVLPDALKVALYELELQRRKNLRPLYIFAGLAIISIVALFAGIITALVANIPEEKLSYFLLPTIVMLVFCAITGSVLFTDYRQKIKSVFIPTFLEHLWPGFRYEPYMHIESSEIPQINTNPNLNKNIYVEKGEDYLEGQIGRFKTTLCEITMAMSEEEDRHTFQGLLLRIEGLPADCSIEWLHAQATLQEALNKISGFWGTPYWVNGKRPGTMFLYISSSKSFLEIWPHEHFLRSKLLGRIQQELHLVLHVVEVLEHLLKSKS